MGEKNKFNLYHTPKDPRPPPPPKKYIKFCRGFILLLLFYEWGLAVIGGLFTGAMERPPCPAYISKSRLELYYYILVTTVVY